MKKKMVFSLSLALMMSVAGTVFASPSTSSDANAKELADLKTRIAALEKGMQTKANKSDNKIDFQGSDLRVRWINDGAKNGNSVFEQRVRLNMNYKVNEDIAFNARWRVMNENEFGTSGSKDVNTLSDANVIMKNTFGTAATTTIGRFGHDFGATSYWNSTGWGLIDGFKITTGKDVKIATGFASFKNLTTGTPATSKIEDAYFLTASYNTSKATTLYGMWVKEQTGTDSNYDVRGLGARIKLPNDFQFWGDYTRNYGLPGNPAGSYLSLRWKGADAQKPGTFGMRLDYRDIETGNMFSTVATSSNIPTAGFRGPAVSAHWAVAKNTVIEGFQTFSTKSADNGTSKPNYSRIQMSVIF